MARPALRLTAVALVGLAALALTALAAAAPATAVAAGPGDYLRCDTLPGTQLVQVARTTCAAGTAGAQALAVAPAGQEQAALAAAGWTAIRASAVGSANDIVALRHRAVLRVRRPGAPPDIDGVTAGRELIFSRAQLTGGAPVRGTAAICTSAFLVRLGGRPAALSAGHCAGLRSDGTADLRNVGLRRPPQAGVVLGRVLRMVRRTAPYDALLVPAPQGPGRTLPPIVNRTPRRPPWIVAGVAHATGQRRVCFIGRTSGIDRCGRLVGAAARGVERRLRRDTGVVEVCTNIHGEQGDSGGPVYTAPGSDGRVRAVGIVSLGVGLFGSMCFTPVAPVLDRLGATLVTG